MKKALAALALLAASVSAHAFSYIPYSNVSSTNITQANFCALSFDVGGAILGYMNNNSTIPCLTQQAYVTPLDYNSGAGRPGMVSYIRYAEVSGDTAYVGFSQTWCGDGVWYRPGFGTCYAVWKNYAGASSGHTYYLHMRVTVEDSGGTQQGDAVFTFVFVK